MRSDHANRVSGLTRDSIARHGPRARAAHLASTAATGLLTLLTGLGWAASPSSPTGTGDGHAVADAVPSSGAPGRTPGLFAVSSTGAATYRIPIWTPPGAGRVGLGLALVYNSRAGNGVMGLGWSLAGLSSISRCNRTIASDGAAAPVTNSLADRYCLDGQPLKLVSGSYGADASVYATEVESFARVVAGGATGNGPESFTVTSRNGLVYEYGTTVDSRVYAGASSAVRTWALSRIRDRAAGSSGNYVSISYSNQAQPGDYTNGTFRVASISYPVTATGQGPFYRVSFTYSQRPAGDAITGYLAGNVVHETNRLDSIAVRSETTGATIKTYRLAYTQGPTSGRLLLDSVQECSVSGCLAPTTIDYLRGARGWNSAATVTPNKASYKDVVYAVDLNGDGFDDLFFPVGLGNSQMSWRASLGGPGGYGPVIDAGLVTPAGTRIIPGRFLGNGRAQLLIPQGSAWTLVSYAGYTFVSSATGLALNGEFASADFDGDGLDDLASLVGGAAIELRVRRNLTVPAAGLEQVTFASASMTAWTVPTGRMFSGFSGWRVADFDGDGRADMAAHTYKTTKRGGSWLTPLLSNGFTGPFTAGVERPFLKDAALTPGDWNADGCTDLLQASQVLVSDCAGGFTSIATGAGGLVYDLNGLATILPADWDDDGRTDLVYVSSWGGSGRRWYVVRSTGSGAEAPVGTGIAAPNASAWFVLDADGDGRPDLGLRDDGHNGSLRFHPRLSPGTPADLATSFVDGFGMSQSLDYTSISVSNHTRESDAAFPEIDFSDPVYVASRVTSSDGTGGTFGQQYRYYGARLHLQGRGFEGFHTVRMHDLRDGTYSYDYFQRSFPYTGMHTQRTLTQPDGTTKLDEWTASVAQQELGSASERRAFPYVAAATRFSYEAGGALDGQLITQTTESYDYADGHGNRTQFKRSVTDMDASSPFAGSTWRTTVAKTYVNDETTHCLGLPGSTVATQEAPGQAVRTQTAAYDVDTSACRVSRQTIEPGNPSLKVTTTLVYDGCGNVGSIAVAGSTPAGSPMPTRSSRFDYGARCQLPETLTDALGQAARVDYDYDFGVPLSLTDPNGITTRWQYDDFGRRVLESRADQTTTSWSFESCSAGPCWGAQDLRFHVYETSKGSSGEVYDQRERLYDGLERLRSSQYQRVLGVWTIENATYDSLGRLLTIDRPTSGAGNGHVSRTYDVLGRLIAETLHRPDGAPDRTLSITYAGRNVRVTDPLGRTRGSTVDVTGRLRRVTDPAPGGTTLYDYDSAGNLVRIEDPIGAVSTGTYNMHGFRTRWTDADRGTWTFSPNSLNELVAWTDARGQSFTATYDALGRLVSRTEPEGTSSWTWGSSALAHDLGRLRSMSGYGYDESVTYDTLGRVASRTVTTDQAYRYDYAYDANGQLESLTYPASPVPTGQGGSRFKVHYAYSYGEPVRISDVTDASAVPRALWALDAANDFGSPTSETLGANLVAVASDYQPWTNALTGRRSGPVPATSDRQNLAYRWDAAGNLTRRQDLNRALDETFTVDQLDRVTGSTLNGSSNFAATYDAAGNLTGRSDTGVIGYGDAAHPHAVTSAGGHAYTYDANGNQITRDGASQAWASFNLPVQLAQPVGGSAFLSQFSYGPDHRRWKQVAAYSNGIETTLYAGGLLEKESSTSTGRTYWRHYVRAPSGATVVVSRNSDASVTTTYLLPDHLGGTDAMLNASGNVIARESFTAFGARRGGDWSSATAPDWAAIANTNRHGYTGHEHLDNLLLVHMNGRVYDPGTGRFLSVDPVIGDLGDSQQVNPYAYVGNRPLRYTDPSGYEVGGCVQACIAIAQSILQTVAGLMGSPEPYRPPATALPGQSAQSGMGTCGPGQWSAACQGWLLSASATPASGGDDPTSTWAHGADDDSGYSADNRRQFAIDLAVNAVDVLVLAPYYDAMAAYEAVQDGDYLLAVVYTGMVACDVAKPCEAAAKAVKPLARAAKGAKNAARVAERAAGEAIPSAGGVVRRFEQQGPKTYFRVYSGSATTGGWLTATPPHSSVWAKEALALPPWNEATYVQKVTVPDGTLLERSRAIPVAEWGRYRGGAEQFQLLEAIPDRLFGPGVPLP